MPINPQHHGSLTYADRSNEKSTVKFNFGPVTALTIAGFLADFGAFRAATNAISQGQLIQDSWTGDTTKYSNNPAAAQAAKREIKAEFHYEDVTTLGLYRIEVPVFNDGLAGLFLSSDTDEIDLTQPAIAAWITAFETLAKSDDGNDVNVLRGYVVGRNL